MVGITSDKQIWQTIQRQIKSFQGLRFIQEIVIFNPLLATL